MERFKFINEADLSSGKITSRRVRKTIRAHVMTQHWATGSRAGHQSMLQPSKKVEEKTKTFRLPPRGTESEITLRQNSAFSNDIVGNDSLPGIANEPCTEADRPEIIERPSRHLNRVTDAFVYAGSNIDMKSYSFFHHYSSEFHIGLCSDIQPITIYQTSVCCAAAIQENSVALLHAICYTGAIHEAAARDYPSQSPNHPENARELSGSQKDAFRHKVSALTQLNKLLASKNHHITEATILCVAILLGVEAIFGDIAALNVHSKGLSRMIDIFGGEEVLSPATSTLVLLIDVKAAAVRQARPVFPLRPYVRHRLNLLTTEPCHGADSVLLALGSRFLSYPLSLQISPELQQYLPCARHLIIMSEQHRTRGNNVSASGIDDFTALEHKLLSLPHEAALNELSECLRVALLLYSNLALWKTPLFFGWITALAAMLKTALIDLDWESKNHGPEVRQLLIWMLLLGGQATRDQDAVEAAWWTLRLRLIAQSLNLKEWQEAVQVLEGFFYVEMVNRKPWERIWRATISRDEGLMPLDPSETKCPCIFNA